MSNSLVDVLAGLDEAVDEAEKLRQASSLFNTTPVANPLADWLMLQGLASAVEKIYTHVEGALYRITQYVDKMPLPKDGGWHMNLLTRMHTAIADIRPAVLSDNTYQLAKSLCAFRHLERGIYGTDLDRKRVLEQAQDMAQFPEMVRHDVLILAKRL